MKKVCALVGIIVTMWGIAWGVFYPHCTWISVIGMLLLGIASYLDRKEQEEKEWNEYYRPRHARRVNPS